MAVISEYTPFFVTSKGLQLEAKVKAGLTPLKLVKAVIGEGYLQEGTDLLSIQSLVSEIPSHQTGTSATSATVDFDRYYDEGGGSTVMGVRIENGDIEFKLREIAIVAEDPDDGEIFYGYVNFGDHVSTMMAYNGKSRITRHFNFPIVMRNAEDINVTITYKGEVYFEDLRKEIDERKAADAALKDEVQTALADFGNSIIADITIPISTWTQQEADAQGYTYYADVTLQNAKTDQFPNVALHKESRDAAVKARICPTVQALDGVLRFWAKHIPAEEIKATVALLKTSNDASGGSGGGNYVLPTATKTRLGGVKIGENINVTPDGTISSSGKLDPSQVATDDEAKQMLDEIFNKKD